MKVTHSMLQLQTAPRTVLAYAVCVELDEGEKPSYADVLEKVTNAGIEATARVTERIVRREGLSA